MTFTPVSNILAEGSRASNDGAERWMSQRSGVPCSGVSRQSPITFQMWPRVPSPTGACTPWPVLTTGAPRTRPSVGFMAMARTRLSPIC